MNAITLSIDDTYMRLAMFLSNLIITNFQCKTITLGSKCRTACATQYTLKIHFNVNNKTATTKIELYTYILDTKDIIYVPQLKLVL
jgi:hypothetical protein